MMTRIWWLVALVPVVAMTLVLGLLRQPPAAAQTMPMPGQPLDQLSGDAFDQAFLEQMIMHHAMAVMMAEPVVQGAVHPEVGNLAANIISAQTNEIAEMRGWLKDWYGIDMPDPMAMMSSMMQTGMLAGDHAHGGQPDPPGMMPGGMPGQGMPMPGMMPGQTGTTPGGMPGPDMSDMAADMMAMMMQQYGSLPGPRLEAVFLSWMVPHHQAAVEMANLAPRRAAHQELKDLAASIVSSQSAEIQQMNGWLGSWYGL
jgi:uncharacterized protein (DUF305 family)